MQSAASRFGPMNQFTSRLSLAVVAPEFSAQSPLSLSLREPWQYQADSWQSHLLGVPESECAWRELLAECSGMAMVALAPSADILLSPRVLCRAAEVAALDGWLLIPPYRVAALSLPESSEAASLYDHFADADYAAAAPDGCLGSIALPQLLICHPGLLRAWWDQRRDTSLMPEYQLAVQELFSYLLAEQPDTGFLLPGEGSFSASDDNVTDASIHKAEQCGKKLSWLGPVGHHALPFLLRSLRESGSCGGKGLAG